MARPNHLRRVPAGENAPRPKKVPLSKGQKARRGALGVADAGASMAALFAVERGPDRPVQTQRALQEKAVGNAFDAQPDVTKETPVAERRDARETTVTGDIPLYMDVDGKHYELPAISTGDEFRILNPPAQAKDAEIYLMMDGEEVPLRSIPRLAATESGRLQPVVVIPLQSTPDTMENHTLSEHGE